MSSLSLQNALASAEMLAMTPSRAEGVAGALEHSLRVLACQLIQTAGVLLRLPQVVAATAQTILHRFYFVCSLRRFGVQEIVLGALFLACKVEEAPRRARDVVNVVHYVVQMYRQYSQLQVLDPYGVVCCELQDIMNKAEMHILKRLAFNVHVQHPYTLMINYVKALKLNSQQGLPQKAWNYLNDSLRTILHTVYQPPTIACAAIFLASRDHKIALPTTPPWVEVFGANQSDVVNAACHILALYQLKLRWDLPLTRGEMESWLMNTNVNEAEIERRLSETGYHEADERLLQRNRDMALDEAKERAAREVRQKQIAEAATKAQSLAAKVKEANEVKQPSNHSRDHNCDRDRRPGRNSQQDYRRDHSSERDRDYRQYQQRRSPLPDRRRDSDRNRGKY